MEKFSGGIILSDTLMITESDVPNYKAFYQAQLETARACRVGGYDDWCIPTVEQWMLIRELFRKFPMPKTGLQPETGLDPTAMYCAGPEYMINLRPQRIPGNLAMTYYLTGTMHGKLRLIRSYTPGVAGTCTIPVTRLGDQYEGGIVFELSPDGQNGKVYIKQPQRTGWGQANQICQKQGLRLPTIDELLSIRELMIHRMDLGIMDQFKLAGVFWSSTPGDGKQYHDLIFRFKDKLPPGDTFPTQPAYFVAIKTF